MPELVPHVVPPPPYDDAVETINAIHHGQVDAVVVIKGVEGPQVVMLEGADKPYHVLVERMSEGAVTVGPDGRILYVNERLSELTGYAVEYFIDRDLATLFDGGAPALAPDESVETNLLRSGKTPLPVKVWARPISIGDTPATLVTLTDLSIYRRAEEIAAAERFARSILEQATNAIIVLGPDGHITHASSIAQDTCRTVSSRPHFFGSLPAGADRSRNCGALFREKPGPATGHQGIPRGRSEVAAPCRTDIPSQCGPAA